MKGRKARASGGSNLAADDLKEKPKDRTEPSGPSKESEEMKKGGRAHRARGGAMKGEGEKKAHMHRKPRKSGGRATSDANPFTSARSGTKPPGRKEMGGVEGFGEG
jgi:hypothetical protein